MVDALITAEQLWGWLAEVPDPEIPVISVVDLGIVRDVEFREGAFCVTVTPTYSGCPASEVIMERIRAVLKAHGVENLELKVQLSPAWTTDWLTDNAKRRLKEYGIAAPFEDSRRASERLGSSLVVLGNDTDTPSVICPLCGSAEGELISRFGSTPCKALYRCLSCLEPFDYFKCH